MEQSLLLNDTAVIVVRLAVVALLYLFLAALLTVLWRDAARAAPGRRGATGRAFLIVVSGPADLKTGQRIPVEGAASIGRESDNQVVIPDKTVSGRHAAIVYRGGRWWVEDLGSRNGTYVNDRRVDGALEIGDGDVIQTGRFAFRLSS